MLEAPDCEAPGPTALGFMERRTQSDKLFIHFTVISVLFYKVNKIFVHIYVFLLLNKYENDGLVIFEDC